MVGSAAIGWQEAGKTFEERGFTCAVWADEAENFAVVDVKADAGQCGDISEALRQAFDLQQFHSIEL